MARSRSSGSSNRVSAKPRQVAAATPPRAATTSPARPAAAAKPVAAARQVTREMIAKRAYEIYASGKGGTADENWRKAEAELRK